jgi:hypothetical protein
MLRLADAAQRGELAPETPGQGRNEAVGIGLVVINVG